MENEKPQMKRIPKLGDTVLYMKFGTPCGTHKPTMSPAMITEVLDESTQECMLFVMNPMGTYHNKTKYSYEPKPGCWSWRD